MRSILTSAVLGLLASVAPAIDREFVPSNGDFHDEFNWSPMGIPGPGDRVIIRGGKTCRLTANATIETVVLGDPSSPGRNLNTKLLIGSDIDPVTLTLTNHNCGLAPTCGGLHSYVDGSIELLDDATLAFTTRDHVMTGDGEILSAESNTPRITIAQGITFRNSLAFLEDGTNPKYGGIRGSLTILGAGTLLNDGIIQAVPLQFRFDPDGDPIIIDSITEDTSNGRWIVNCEARIVSMQDAWLDRDFEDIGETEPFTTIGGSFWFEDVVVLTCGAYIRLGCGGLVLNATPNGFAQFGYADYIDSIGCTDPITSPVSAACGDLEATTQTTGPVEPCVAGG